MSSKATGTGASAIGQTYMPSRGVQLLRNRRDRCEMLISLHQPTLWTVGNILPRFGDRGRFYLP